MDGRRRATVDGNNNHVHNEEAISTPQHIHRPYIHPCDISRWSTKCVECIHHDYYQGLGARKEEILALHTNAIGKHTT